MRKMMMALFLLSIHISACVPGQMFGSTFTPIAISTPSKTAFPTSTLKPTSTYTPTQIPTETPTPIVESDLQPAYIERFARTYMDVEIHLSIITDKSMDSFNPSIHKIYLNPHFYNYEGEKAKDALAHFAAFTFYELWHSRQNTDQPTSDADFKSYLQLWSQAQKSSDAADWEKVQIDGMWANDLNDGNGYKQQKYMIWPMYTGDLTQVPQGVRAITQLGVAIGRSSKMKNITMSSSSNFGFGTNLDGNKLYVYAAWDTNGNVQYTGGWNFTERMTFAMMWLIRNQGGSSISFPEGADKALYILINHHSNPGDCCYSAALKIDPPTRSDNMYNH